MELTFVKLTRAHTRLVSTTAWLREAESRVVEGTREAEYAAATRERMLGNQLDPQEVVDSLVSLCVADKVPFETFKPDNILDRYKKVK